MYMSSKIFNLPFHFLKTGHSVFLFYFKFSKLFIFQALWGCLFSKPLWLLVCCVYLLIVFITFASMLCTWIFIYIQVIFRSVLLDLWITVHWNWDIVCLSSSCLRENLTEINNFLLIVDIGLIWWYVWL